jgi:AbrB family looped-hinge helix DNA binding protein
MSVAIDRAGRLVVPRAIRSEAGIEPGMRLRISVRDGRIEIEPEYAEVTVIRKHGLRIARLAKGGEAMPERVVRSVSRRIRERRDRT